MRCQRDLGERAHRAGRDDHAERLERSRRDSGSDVADRVGVVGDRAQLDGRQVGLIRAGHVGRAGDNEMRLDTRVAE